jgi:hypothetical protein
MYVLTLMSSFLLYTRKKKGEEEEKRQLQVRTVRETSSAGTIYCVKGH